MLHLLQMGPSKVLTTFPLQTQNTWQLSLLELPPLCVPTRNTVTLSSDSSDMYTSTVQSSPLSANAALPPHPRFQTSYPTSAHSVSSLSAPSPPDSLWVVQWNAGGLRASSTELLHFLLSHPVDLICIQESNYNTSSSFRIPGFSALRSDRIPSGSGILAPNATHASGGVIIFVRQGLSFSELSTFFSLCSLDPYSDYVGVNLSINNSSPLSFLNVYAPYSLLSDGWQNRLVFSLHSFLLQKSLHSGRLQLPSRPMGLKRYFRLPRGRSIRLGHLL